MAVNFLGNFDFPIAIGITNANPNPCQDQKVGTLSNGTFSYTSRTDIDYKNSNAININPTSPIIIVLESPHKEEFANDIARGPAMEKTGLYFGNFFSPLLKSSKLINVLTNSQHDVIFMNAIQYQCSLGNKLNGKRSYQNKKQRDLNWLTCFNNNYSNDLVRRINAIKPYAVINLCTMGFSNLQLYVDRAVCSYINGITKSPIYYTIGRHPSTWIYGTGVIQ